MTRVKISYGCPYPIQSSRRMTRSRPRLSHRMLYWYAISIFYIVMLGYVSSFVALYYMCNIITIHPVHCPFTYTVYTHTESHYAPMEVILRPYISKWFMHICVSNYRNVCIYFVFPTWKQLCTTWLYARVRLSISFSLLFTLAFSYIFLGIANALLNNCTSLHKTKTAAAGHPLQYVCSDENDFYIAFAANLDMLN